MIQLDIFSKGNHLNPKVKVFFIANFLTKQEGKMKFDMLTSLESSTHIQQRKLRFFLVLSYTSYTYTS